MALLVNTDRLQQALAAVKTYIDTQDTAISTTISTGLTTLTDGKVDKTVAGVGEKIVKAIAYTQELLTGANDVGANLKITTTKLSLEDGSTETLTDNINLAVASGVVAIRPQIQTNKDDIAELKEDVNALEAILGIGSGSGGATETIPEQIEAINDALDGKQPLDDGLTSLAGLSGVGVVKSTAADTYEIGKINDADVNTGEALKYAIDAFATKDGKVKASQVLDSTGTAVLDSTGTVVTVGKTGSSVVLTNVANGDGLPGIYAKDPEGGSDQLIWTSVEVKKQIDEAVTAGASYYGKYTFYADDATLAGAKAKVEAAATAPAVGMSAVAFDSATGKMATGTNDGTNWTWTDLTKSWNNGGWAWVEDLLGVATASPLPPSGRIVLNTNPAIDVMDTIPDREAVPDEFGLTHNSTGAISLKMAVLSQYGSTSVSNALNASNLGYGDGKTIAEKIAEIDYTVATAAEVQTILDTVFGA